MTVNGELSPYSVSVEVGGCYKGSTIEYNLGRKWEAFDATIGLADSSKAGVKIAFQVTADGSQVGSYRLGLGESRDIKLSVTNTLRLELTIVQLAVNDECHAGEAVWGDARLTD